MLEKSLCVCLSQQQTVMTMICLGKGQHRKKRAGMQWESRKERADRIDRECGGDRDTNVKTLSLQEEASGRVRRRLRESL